MAMVFEDCSELEFIGSTKMCGEKLECLKQNIQMYVVDLSDRKLKLSLIPNWLNGMMPMPIYQLCVFH